VNTFALATIVEGEGDCAALPVLLRRMRPLWKFPRPIRVPRNKLIDQVRVSPRDEVLQKYLFLADVLIKEQGGFGAVLIVQDADDDCPAALGPALRRRAQALLPSRRCEAVLPKREFEAWFLAGKCVEWSGDPETVSDAKRPLHEALGKYSPTADQARLAQGLDLDAASKARSFRQLMSALSRLDEIANSDKQ